MSTLAIHGGTPVQKKTVPHWPVIQKRDEEALLRAYDSADWGIHGEENQRFCRDFAAYSDAKHCLTVANGTVSLELLLRALNIGRGDEVILPPYTFIATVSSLLFAGVTPVFADLSPDTMLLDPDAVEKVITPRTKAVVPVFVGGRPVDPERYEALCQKHGLYLILDAAQAVGTQFNHKGLGAYGTVASISCQNSKNLTCGEGGILLTNDDALYEKLREMIDGGRSADGRIRSLSLASGMSEFQAAVLNSQLPSLDEQIEKRMASAELLDRLLSPLPFVKTLKKDEHITRNSLHLYLLQIREEMLKGVPVATFLKAVRQEGAPLNPGYAPLYDFPCLSGDYARRCMGRELPKADTPVAERLRTEGCWFYHADLLRSPEEVSLFADALQKVYENLDSLR